ncbi:MAG TPA: FAD-dependent oxidoreductase [Polyangiales bacterium]|nr:FAD-dependent oxidoreductase [Polyangiales bacterium]
MAAHEVATLPLDVLGGRGNMSDVRTAVLRSARDFGSSRWLRVELSDNRPLRFRGGQYIIVDTGLRLEDGRPRRRAYSMLSPDSDSQHFELGVFKLPGGAGSGLMNHLREGSELRFTGPWGKLQVPDDLAIRPGPVWIIATDSGASAAVGLVRSNALAPHLARVQLWHFRTHPDAFLSDDFLREQLADLTDLRSAPLASVQAPLRAMEIERWLQEQLAITGELPAQVYITGDGLLARQSTAQLIAAGMAEQQIQTESFFNHEKKASVS